MWKVGIGFILGIVICLLWGDLVFAHQAQPTAAKPLGWAYPLSCCSGDDCASATLFKVHETKNGYAFTILPGQHQLVKDVSFSDLISYQDKRIRDSPDGLFHVCVGARYLDNVTRQMTQRTICLFVPPRGF